MKKLRHRFQNRAVAVTNNEVFQRIRKASRKVLTLRCRITVGIYDHTPISVHFFLLLPLPEQQLGVHFKTLKLRKLSQ